MGKIISLLRKITFITLTLVMVYQTYNKIYIEGITSNGSLHILSSKSKSYYSALTDNTGYTNINGVSNFYINMSEEGYNIVKEEVTNSFIDTTWSNGELSYRLYYKYPECYIAIFSSDYVKSYKGISYIIEEED